MLSSLSCVLFGLPDALLGPSSKKKKIHYPENVPIYFGKWNSLALILKKILYFLILPKPKKVKKESFSYIFSKEVFSYISENGTLHFPP